MTTDTIPSAITDAHMIVLAYLRDAESIYPDEIADSLGVAVEIVEELLGDLLAAGLAEPCSVPPGHA